MVPRTPPLNLDRCSSIQRTISPWLYKYVVYVCVVYMQVWFDGVAFKQLLAMYAEAFAEA